MIRPAGCLLAVMLGIGGTAMAQAPEASLRERLRALAAPPVPSPAPDEVYAEEIASDLARIGAHGAALFGPDGAAIAVFTGPDCADCPAAEAELAAVLDGLGLTAVMLDVSVPENAALMAALTLDTLPSYVMPDRLIRGQIPAFVLERYLTEMR